VDKVNTFACKNHREIGVTSHCCFSITDAFVFILRQRVLASVPCPRKAITHSPTRVVGWLSVATSDVEDLCAKRVVSARVHHPRLRSR
jgi:hypothetical protein